MSNNTRETWEELALEQCPPEFYYELTQNMDSMKDGELQLIATSTMEENYEYMSEKIQ